MFEVLEHTADIGFRARGRTLAGLFESAAEALVALALELEDVSPRESYTLAAEGEDLESLLVNWLSEVLYWLDGKRVALRRFQVREIASSRVAAEGFGEPLDPSRHRAKLVVKGVTYHQLRIEQDEQGWVAEVFLDI
ncbi:MAG: archease [Bryobacteraceae bacterium]|jgi:SHS2 domain-containing protein